MPTVTDLTGPAGPLEAALDRPADGRPDERLRPRSSSRIRIRSRRDDAHEGGVSGREGAGADRMRGAAVQLPRRRPQRRTFDDGAGEKEDFTAALDYMARAIPAAALGGGLLVRLVGRARNRRRRRSRVGADRHRAAGRHVGLGKTTTFPNTLASTKPKFFVQGEADEICPLEGMWRFYGQLPEPKELVVIDGRIISSRARRPKSAKRSKICSADF